MQPREEWALAFDNTVTDAPEVDNISPAKWRQQNVCVDFCYFDFLNVVLKYRLRSEYDTSDTSISTNWKIIQFQAPNSLYCRLEVQGTVLRYSTCIEHSKSLYF